MSGAAERNLRWEGCWNVRDLGGLTTPDGSKTRFGSIVRSDDPCKLTLDCMRLALVDVAADEAFAAAMMTRVSEIADRCRSDAGAGDF